MANIRSFFIQLFSFSLITMGVLLLWQHYASARFQTNLGWGIWLFFIAITAIIHVVLMKASDNSPKSLITWFMAITGIKLFTYLTIILIYGVLKGEKALGFVILFLLFYFLYSAFEVATLLRSFKKAN